MTRQSSQHELAQYFAGTSGQVPLNFPPVPGNRSQQEPAFLTAESFRRCSLSEPYSPDCSNVRLNAVKSTLLRVLLSEVLGSSAECCPTCYKPAPCGCH